MEEEAREKRAALQQQQTVAGIKILFEREGGGEH